MLKQLNEIFSRKEKITLGFLVLLIVIGSFLELMSVTLFMPFIEILMDTSQIYENKFLAYFYQQFRFQSTEHFLAAIAGCIIGIYVFKNIYLIFEKNTIYRFSYKTQMKLSTKLLESYMQKPYTFHLNKNIAHLQRSLQEDTDLFTKAIIHAMELLVELTVCIALGLYLFNVSQSITVITVALLILCVFIFYNMSKKFSKSMGKECQQYKAKIYQWMNQSLGGIKEIKILNREKYFIDIYRDYFKKYARGLKGIRLMGVLPKYFVEMFSMTGLLIAIIIKMLYGQKEDVTEFIPQLAAFAVAAFRLLPSVGRINEHTNNMMYSIPSIELIYQDLKEVESLPEVVSDKDEQWQFTDKIRIRNVKYHYPEAEEMVIDGAEFEIKKGTSVAFIGSSGSGKSTMADIILGLLSPAYGKVEADGLNIHKNLGTWHKEIGYIPQVIYLSDDTIRKNVAFGVRDEDIEEEAVLAAVKKAQLSDFIEDLPEGLNTYVGDRGVRLSGGQRQRIGIARALYHDPDVLILDEATSALDHETEAAVMESIESLHGTKTMIIIAHRLSTIRNVDVIYEVENGKLLLKDKTQVYNTHDN